MKINMKNETNFFDKAKENEDKEALAQSGIENIRKGIELTLKAYNVTREELKTRKYDNRIRIIRSG